MCNDILQHTLVTGVTGHIWTEGVRPPCFTSVMRLPRRALFASCLIALRGRFKPVTSRVHAQPMQTFSTLCVLVCPAGLLVFFFYASLPLLFLPPTRSRQRLIAGHSPLIGVFLDAAAVMSPFLTPPLMCNVTSLRSWHGGEPGILVKDG